MEIGKLTVGFRKSLYKMGYDLFIYRDMGNNKAEAIKSLTWEMLETETIDKYSGSVQPIFIPNDIADALFIAMQEEGMKPRSQSFVEGKLEATEKHLEDMRSLSKLNK